jgi:redoxin
VPAIALWARAAAGSKTIDANAARTDTASLEWLIKWLLPADPPPIPAGGQEFGDNLQHSGMYRRRRPAPPYTFAAMGLLALGLGIHVLIFTSVDCPISNRYAPDVRRLQERFAVDGVRVSLVFANPHDTPAAVRDHTKAFGYRMEIVLDPRQDLVKRTGATVTPEAAVFDRAGRLVYRGRIDDRYPELGVDRQTPTTHDLEDAVTATLAGRPVARPITRAVGCYLADFAR